MEAKPVMTCKEISELLNIPTQYINNFAKALHIKPVVIITPKGRKNTYTESDFEAMKSYFKKRFKSKLFQPSRVIEVPEAPLKKQELIIEGKTIEEWKKEHPLVKDSRFFRTSYFPDCSIE